MTQPLVLALSPEAAATELALFRGADAVAHETARHADERRRAPEELAVRTAAARAFLVRAGVRPGSLAAVAGPGRGPRNDVAAAADDAAALREDAGVLDVALLGELLAQAVAEEHGCPALLVNASADELDALARATAPDARRDACCALVLRSAALRHAAGVGRALEELRLVVAFIGRRTSVAALRDGRVVDVIGPLDDAVDAARAAERGDPRAIVRVEGIAYQVAKAVGALASALSGEVNAIVVSGRAEAAAAVVASVCRRVEWIAPVFVEPGDGELAALAEHAVRVLGAEAAAARRA